jgi:hypothetical protein
MECNADAFEVNDRVLVEFVDQEWDNARVIGFESNPRRCSYDFYLGYRVRAIAGTFPCRGTVNLGQCPAISSIPGGWVLFDNTDWIVDLPAGRHFLYPMTGSMELQTCGYTDVRLNGITWDYLDVPSRKTWRALNADNVLMPNGLCPNASGSLSWIDGPETAGPTLPEGWVAPPKKITSNGNEWTFVGMGTSSGIGGPPTFFSENPAISTTVYIWYAR